MNKPLFFSALAGLGLAATGLHAQEVQPREMGRVISSVPVIQQVAVPREVCNSAPVLVEQPRSGAGALMGAIAGGAVGNAIGGGGGRAAATILGVVGGAMLGDRVEGPNTQLQQQTACTTQTTYENRTAGYNVTYEYAGRQYTVQMPYDPGPTLPLQVMPAGVQAPPPPAPAQPMPYSAPYSAPYSGPSAPPVIIREVVEVPRVVAPIYAPAYGAAYAVPYGYYAPAYRPFVPNVSLNLGYVRRSGGGDGHYRR